MRKFVRDDLETLIALRSDDDVIRYLGGRTLQNPVEIEKRLGFYLDCYEKYGFGMCAMFWKESGEMFGWSGLQPLAETGEIEVGYGMIKEFWGRGIGFECAKAWLTYAFTHTTCERIVAVASPENVGSWRIMEKCGMKREKTDLYYGFECHYYGIAKADFEL